jgi:hypothetical protein
MKIAQAINELSTRVLVVMSVHRGEALRTSFVYIQETHQSSSTKA